MTETVLSDGPVSKTGWLSRREPTCAGPASPATQRAELSSSSERPCVHAEIALHGTRLLRHKGPKYNALSTPIHELTSRLRALKENKAYGPFLQVVAKQLRKPTGDRHPCRLQRHAPPREAAQAVQCGPSQD